MIIQLDHKPKAERDNCPGEEHDPADRDAMESREDLAGQESDEGTAEREWKHPDKSNLRQQTAQQNEMFTDLTPAPVAELPMTWKYTGK